MEIGVLAALHGFEHLNLAAPDPDLGPKLELASRHHGETEHASSQAKAPQSSTPAPCSLITVRASFSSRSPANLECRRWSEGSIREIRYAPRAGVEPTSPRRRILSGISRLARQVGYARLVFLPRSRPESAAPRSLLPCGEFEYGIEPFRQPSLSRRWSWDPTSVCPSNRSDEVLRRTTGSGTPGEPDWLA